MAGLGKADMTVSQVIQKIEMTLNRCGVKTNEVVDQLGEVKQLYIQVISFYEGHLQQKEAEEKQIKEYIAGLEKAIETAQQTIGAQFVIEIPKRPDCLTKPEPIKDEKPKQ